MERTGILIGLLSFILPLFPIVLYAETHYRFRYFFSFLRKREPEIIADAPHRIEPQVPLPVLVIVKDAHLFPAELSKVLAIVSRNGKIIVQEDLLASPVPIKDRIWNRVFLVPLNGVDGWIDCDIVLTIKNRKKQKTYRNDNYRTSSHRPLRIFVSKSPLPRLRGLHFGECHSHSAYSDDQVEFGAPLDGSPELCRALGLSFQCITDHSYDLDDSRESYLHNDPAAPKWRDLRRRTDALNRRSKNFTLVCGEEVSCRNSAGENVHLLLMGNKTLVPGSGDGAERWLKTRSEYAIVDILRDLGPATAAFAAHPRESVPLLQRVLLNRGQWSEKDIDHPGLTGIQFLNGKLQDGFLEGRKFWIDRLLCGGHLFALAGDDAHGNFNRFRQIGIPFLKIRESGEQLFGKMRTGVFLQSLSEQSIIRALRGGSYILTDGPVANLKINSPGGGGSSIGRSCTAKRCTLTLEARTSEEFGFLQSVEIFRGFIGEKAESIVYSERPRRRTRTIGKLKLIIDRRCYIRAEIWTSPARSCDRQAHFCLTNPVWLSPGR
jgi:hypothetical protein